MNEWMIEYVKSYSHIGHIINARINDGDDICHRRGTFIWQVNNVLCYFSALNSPTKCKLFQSYCTSFHGCELWRLSDFGVQYFCTSWRKSVRKIWKLPYSTHCHLCRYCAIAYLLMTKYVHDHLILSTDVFHMTLIWSDLFLSIV